MSRIDTDDLGQRSQLHDERKRSRHVDRDEEGSARLELARLREIGLNLGKQIDQQVQKRPYAVIGAAAGVGFVAGSLLGSRLGQMAIAAGIGYLARNALRSDFSLERELERLGRERTAV